MGATALAKKVMRVGYFWQTMVRNTRDYVKNCDQCQRHVDIFNTLPIEFHVFTSPWSSLLWGLDILSSFTPTLEQLKYLIVFVDYFTKWIEAEALVNITTANILKFFKRDILVRFTVPQSIVMDNGTHFINRRLEILLENLKTK